MTKDKNHRSVNWAAYIVAGVGGTLVGCFMALMPYVGL